MVYAYEGLRPTGSIPDVILFLYGQNYPSIFLPLCANDMWTPLVISFLPSPSSPATDSSTRWRCLLVVLPQVRRRAAAASQARGRAVPPPLASSRGRGGCRHEKATPTSRCPSFSSPSSLKDLQVLLLSDAATPCSPSSSVRIFHWVRVTVDERDLAMDSRYL